MLAQQKNTHKEIMLTTSVGTYTDTDRLTEWNESNFLIDLNDAIRTYNSVWNTSLIICLIITIIIY